LKNQSQIKQLCTLFGRSEKKKHQRQFDNHTSSRVTPCEREHSGAFKDMVEGRVKPLGGVECIVKMVQTSPTY
jgi:hypothetical protein